MSRVIHGIVLVGLGLGLTSCSSSGGPDTGQNKTAWYDPGPILKQKIEERIAQIPLQHGDEKNYNMQWIAQQGEAAVPALLVALEHENPKLRSNAAWVLGAIGDVRVLPELRARREDSSEIVRLEVARSMMLLGDMEGLPVLIAGLDSESQFVRHECHKALSDGTGRDFGYDHRAQTPAERRDAIAQWQKWWEERKDNGWFTAGKSQNTPASPTGR